MNVELPRSSHPRPTAPRASPTMPKCTNGAIWSRTSSAVSRHSDASQPATKKPMLVLPASSISLPPSSQSGDCKQALVHTAAASNLGQMLNRVCLKDRIPLVNVVRSQAQAEILHKSGAQHVLDSASP